MKLIRGPTNNQNNNPIQPRTHPRRGLVQFLRAGTQTVRRECLVM